MSTAAPVKYFFPKLLIEGDALATALGVRGDASLTSGTITGFECFYQLSSVPALVRYTGKMALEPIQGKIYECTGEGGWTQDAILQYKIGNHNTYKLQGVDITLEDGSKVPGMTFVWAGKMDGLSAVIPAAKKATADTQTEA